MSDPKAAQSALRDLQAQFDAVGHVPRDSMRRLDDQMRAAEQRVRDAVDAEWRQASVETNPFLSALRDRLAEAEAKLERARKSGDEARIAKAEAEVGERRSLIPEYSRVVRSSPRHSPTKGGQLEERPQVVRPSRRYSPAEGGQLGRGQVGRGAIVSSGRCGCGCPVPRQARRDVMPASATRWCGAA